jgi:hypothetical protein
MPEITVEEGVIRVRLPAAIERGLAARILREIPQIPENRLKELRASLEKFYPKETELLNQVTSLIQKAGAISGGR